MVPGITTNDVDSNNPIGGVDGGKFQINVDGQQVTQNNSSSGMGQPRFSQLMQSANFKSLPTASMPRKDARCALRLTRRPRPEPTLFTAPRSVTFATVR